MDADRDDVAWLWDMLQACRYVETFVTGVSFHQFESNPLVRSAVERQIEIIGEAARHVSQDFQNAHPEISWRPIIAQCHVLAHDYGEIRYDLIWRVATVHIPELIAILVPILPMPPSGQTGDPASAAEE